MRVLQLKPCFLNYIKGYFCRIMYEMSGGLDVEKTR
jgi:hypothetical protein